MRVAIVAPPFIPVPPVRYGGTELFIAELASGLKAQGLDVVLYTIAESTLDVEKRWTYKHAQWPVLGEVYDNLKDVYHTAWSVRDAFQDCDVIHLNNVPGLVHSMFPGAPPFVYTMHHEHDDKLSDFYAQVTNVHFVTISDFQRRLEKLPRIRTIHHGVDPKMFTLNIGKRDHLSFLGRIAPVKGTHLAIDVAKRSGIPLKIAGEVQPLFKDYFESAIKPHIDGKFIEFVGEADMAAKNELLGGSIAMLFPIQWNEPFGLVMIESMMCGTPVLALPGGAVDEVVHDGVSGFVCKDTDVLVERVADVSALSPASVRKYAEKYFSTGRMVDEYLSLYREITGRELKASAAADNNDKPRFVA